VDAKRIEAVLTYDFRTPKLSAAEWIVVAAKAPELPRQVKVTTTLTPPGVAGKELSPLHRPIITARVPAKGTAKEKGIVVRVTYQATLRSRKLVPLRPTEQPPAVAPLTDTERRNYLAPSKTINFKDKPFQKWLDEHALRRAKGETDIAFARRVFLHIQKSFTYKFPTGHDGTASAVVRAGCGDCGSMSVVFASALRASGIPARTLVGRWADSVKPGDKIGAEPYYQTHVKAEFFAEQVGWVPVDPTQALGDASPASLRYFGNDPGDFLVQNVDFDLLLDSVHFGKEHIDHLQGVVRWATGSGSWDGKTTREDWQVRTLTGKAR
jgi:transglutaminase-like putative cysteine protease